MPNYTKLGGALRELSGSLLKYGKEPGAPAIRRLEEETPSLRLLGPGLKTPTLELTSPRGVPIQAPLKRFGKRGLNPASLSTSPDVRNWAVYTTPSNSEFITASMIDVPAGTGAAERFYPYLGELAAQRGAYVLPEWVLSQANEGRRSVDTLGTLLRNRRPVFVPHEQQLDPVGLGVDLYMGSSPDEQAGALLAASNQIAKQRLLNSMLIGQNHSDKAARQLYNNVAKKYGMDYEGMSLGALEDPATPLGTLKSAVNELRGVGVRQIGDKTLRRQQLENALQSGAPLSDETIEGLFFKTGGSVHR